MYIAVDVIVGVGRAGSSVQVSTSIRPHFKLVQGTGHLEVFNFMFQSALEVCSTRSSLKDPSENAIYNLLL